MIFGRGSNVSTVTQSLLAAPHRQPVVQLLKSLGFVDDDGILAIAWSNRSGLDYTDLEFHPCARHKDDFGWAAVIGCHASGTNPRMQIGTCETIEDVRLVHDVIRHVNGYQREHQ